MCINGNQGSKPNYEPTTFHQYKTLPETKLSTQRVTGLVGKIKLLSQSSIVNIFSVDYFSRSFQARSPQRRFLSARISFPQGHARSRQNQHHQQHSWKHEECQQRYPRETNQNLLQMRCRIRLKNRYCSWLPCQQIKPLKEDSFLGYIYIPFMSCGRQRTIQTTQNIIIFYSRKSTKDYKNIQENKESFSLCVFNSSNALSKLAAKNNKIFEFISE